MFERLYIAGTVTIIFLFYELRFHLVLDKNDC